MYGTGLQQDLGLEFEQQRPRQSRRGLVLLMVLTVLGFGAGLLLVDLRGGTTERGGIRPLQSLWPAGSFETPQSYELWTSDGSYIAARQPNQWRAEVGGFVSVGDGQRLWDTHGPGFIVLPFASAVTSGAVTDVPQLVGGAPMTIPDETKATRRIFSSLGPTSPETLIVMIESVRTYGGTWNLQAAEFLGRPVTVLTTHMNVSDGDESGLTPHQRRPNGSYVAEYWIDDEYLFVLKSSVSMNGIASSNEVTDIRFDQPIADSVFQFTPPPGKQLCMPPNYVDRGPGC